MFNKLLSVFLCIAIFFNFAPVIFAENDYSVEQIYLHNGLEKQPFSVIKVNDELYATAEEISKIFNGHTGEDGKERFTIKENEQNLVFKLGEKFVMFSKENKKITVSPVSFSQSYSGTIKHNGAYYYPLSEALPWMNVEYNVDNGVLVIKPDAKSLWEVSEDLIFDSELTFNFVEAVGDGTKVTTSLILAHVFDGLMNLSAERLIGNHKTGETLDTYNDYYDCFIEMATDDFLESDAAMAVFKDMKTINKIAGTTEEMFFGGDADAKISKFLEDIQVDGDTWLAYGDVSDKLSEAATVVKAGSALSDWVKSLKVMEIATKTTVGYLDALKCQAEAESNTSLHTLAANKALLALEDKGNAAIVSIADATKNAIVGEVLDVGNLLGGVGIVLDAVDIALTLVWPVNKKASEVSKLLIYGPIQNSALASAKTYKATASTAKDIYLAKVNYMLALLASKQSYEAILSFADDTTSVNANIDKINKVLTELAICEACEDNDAICDKKAETTKIKETLGKIKIMKYLPEPTLNKDGFYELYTTEHVVWFNKQYVNNKKNNLNAILMADIDLNNGYVFNNDGTAEYNGKTVSDGWYEWNSIGTFDKELWYTGVFDGNGHTIRGIYTSAKDTKYIGVFGCIDDTACIKNLTIENSFFYGYNETGGIVGQNYGLVDNCCYKGIVRGNVSVGGIVGQNYGTVKNCTNNGYIEGNYGVGGIIGDNDAAVQGCHNTGSVYGIHDRVGGVVGGNYITIKECTNSGKVTGFDKVGGIVGDSGDFGEIYNCSNSGNVTGHDMVGGIGGYVDKTYGSSNSGSVEGNKSVGGAFGIAHWGVEGCNNSGTVIGNTWVGGFAGLYTSEALDCAYSRNSAEHGIGFCSEHQTEHCDAHNLKVYD